MEGWYEEWERRFFRRNLRKSKYSEPLEALRRDLWTISHPGQTMPECPHDIPEFPKKRRLRFTKFDRAFAREVGIRTKKN